MCFGRKSRRVRTSDFRRLSIYERLGQFIIYREFRKWRSPRTESSVYRLLPLERICERARTGRYGTFNAHLSCESSVENHLETEYIQKTIRGSVELFTVPFSTCFHTLCPYPLSKGRSGSNSWSAWKTKCVTAVGRNNLNLIAVE